MTLSLVLIQMTCKMKSYLIMRRKSSCTKLLSRSALERPFAADAWKLLLSQ